jgi:hypothetical protein
MRAFVGHDRIGISKLGTDSSLGMRAALPPVPAPDDDLISRDETDLQRDCDCDPGSDDDLRHRRCLHRQA